jgi:hypothetical protein
MKAKYLGWAMLVVVLSSIGLFADNKDIIKQGDFALILVGHTSTPAPQGGWTIDSAVSLLQDIGIAPFSGSWSSEQEMTEGDMAHIMRLLGLPIYSVNPDEKVTWGRANAVFYRYDDFLKNFNLKTRTVYGSTTTHVDTAVGGSDSLAPASPTTP